MEQVTLNFTARGSALTAADNCTPTGKVAIYRAVFDLDGGWKSFDQVSAVWSNDFVTISTVLDSDGSCIVPHEVQAHKGKVRVNLVGSIAENGELVQRMTSYTAVALIANEQVKLTGSETEPITPSQFEQFAANVRSDADRAAVARVDAETAADNAAASETNAKTSEDNAKESELNAKASELNAADSESAAAASASSAASDADRAEQGAASAGYMFFYINEDGDLIYERTSNTQVDFYLSNGDLYVEAIA